MLASAVDESGVLEFIAPFLREHRHDQFARSYFLHCPQPRILTQRSSGSPRPSRPTPHSEFNGTPDIISDCSNGKSDEQLQRKRLRPSSLPSSDSVLTDRHAEQEKVNPTRTWAKTRTELDSDSEGLLARHQRRRLASQDSHYTNFSPKPNSPTISPRISSTRSASPTGSVYDLEKAFHPQVLPSDAGPDEDQIYKEAAARQQHAFPALFSKSSSFSQSSRSSFSSTHSTSSTALTFDQPPLLQDTAIDEWLLRLTPALNSYREEAKSLVAFHFAGEASLIGLDENRTIELFSRISAVSALRRLAGSITSWPYARLACRALGYLGLPVPRILSAKVSNWTPSEVACWLARIGFTKLASTVIELGLDGDLLLRLSEDGLEQELGLKLPITRKRYDEVVITLHIVWRSHRKNASRKLAK
ncbi:unnamed protein product [Protopolystoma xenopodis]|uniref:SAM domain-containing protein n=1 Tax=Protopolystoma xenopodis TaxID=117903 RepID=A0A448XNN5_9PLAT|nr:unnamed protein product [Protopolystoma xenopodis]